MESVHGGVVVLGGKAETMSAHRRALEDARSVEGVARVESQIESPNELRDEEIWYDEEVATTDERQPAVLVSDAWITTQAKIKLMADPGLSPLQTNVDTRNGELVLFGTVKSQELKQRAEAEVRDIEGVHQVSNDLQVVPDVAAGETEARDDELRAAVRERIGSRDALRNASVDVEVADATVRLSGSVASQGDRLTALSVARATPGVSAVIDDLRVASAAK